MKKLLFIFLLLIPLSVNAYSVSDLNFKVDKSLEGICPSGNSAFACLDYNTKTVSISLSVLPSFLPFVITHEIGHWLLQDITLEEYQSVFGEGDYHQLSEMAANRFYEFVFMNFMLTQTENNFFNKILTQ